ncbi:hypothetical protein NLI96_g2298 [Meripilus lineatus]|uniref:Uncharacterized protein n=1 Tax=Meripilus lineatus TaxID=2056292 RepID=A0AAD5VAY9_9APHY|nr:hypothetical protein NLI96_g2298 [Physisporinus lineatus]
MLRSPALKVSDWESIVLEDYTQTEDDGHDVISLGISHGDGTLHIGFDQHDNPLNYRVSLPGVASNPQFTAWSRDIFGPRLDHLPGLEGLEKSIYFVNVTYPRFLSLPRILNTTADLLLEMRVGRSGLGDDWLYRYTPGVGWELIGKYLEGVNNNAYINGLDFDLFGNLHVTWTYRDYVNDTGQDVAVQAGPNGPENNHDMDFAFSPDLGLSWLNTWNQPISNVSSGNPIVPTSPGITIFSIPKYGGILNQESQTVDLEGRVHILNRENTTGLERWYHYWRRPAPSHFWTRGPLPLSPALATVNNITDTPTVIGKRGKLFSQTNPPKSSPSSNFSSGTILYAILPSNAPNSTAFSILSSTSGADFNDWKVEWEAKSGCGWEPLFDRYRLTDPEEDGVLSIYVVDEGEVKVLDFEL